VHRIARKAKQTKGSRRSATFGDGCNKIRKHTKALENGKSHQRPLLRQKIQKDQHFVLFAQTFTFLASRPTLAQDQWQADAAADTIVPSKSI
jgi:hypothetical protein